MVVPDVQDYIRMNGKTQVDINGYATLCFSEDGSRFQGAIMTSDESHFIILGMKSQCRGVDSAESCGCVSPNTSRQGVPVSFDIRITDCEIGEEYSLKRIQGRNGRKCTFSCPSISFHTEKVFRGQKADMVAQKCLGHTMDGGKSTVYYGPIHVRTESTEQPHFWVL